MSYRIFCKRTSIVLIAIVVSYYLAISVLAHRVLGFYDLVGLHRTFYRVALFKINRMSFKRDVIFLGYRETVVDNNKKDQCKELIPLFWKCLFSPVQNDHLTLDGNKLNYPLPPFTCTVLTERHTKKYATLTRGSDLTDIDVAMLDKTGWKYAGAISGSYLFKKDGYNLGVSVDWELADQGCIGELYVNVSKD
jgi:hypothetical protein